MPPLSKSFFGHWKQDLPASVVVLLVALPLCLGIALASGAPLFSGLIAGVVGGVVVGALSKSPLSVSGPAAGLTVIVLSAIQELPTFETFLLAVCLAGVIQVALGVFKAGIIGDFIPSAVIKGMLAAIGLILILKQIPYAFGFNASYLGDQAFLEAEGRNTFSSVWQLVEKTVLPGAALISLTSLAFLFWWDRKQPKMTNWLRYVPGPLVVVAFGVAANQLFGMFLPDLAITTQHLVAVPVAGSMDEFIGQFRLPDFSQIGNQAVWITALTLALVASVETLLSVEAVDKLDPYKRFTPTNRELMAQGVGNIASGLIGGLPVTSVIVRSSANVSSGARSKLSTISHGVLLFACVVSIPTLLNMIPLCALAAVLISVGYKLTKPAIYREKYEKGWSYFIPFIVTITAIMLTDLLVGIAIGVVVGGAFVLIENFRSVLLLVTDNDNYLVRFKKDLFFIHKYELKQTLSQIPSGAKVLIDLTRVNFIDLDNVEIINNFLENASHHDIDVSFKYNIDYKNNNLFKVPDYGTPRANAA